MTGPQLAPSMPVQTLDSLRQRAISLYVQYGSWRRVAALWGVSVGTVIRVASGYEPKRTGLRAALGLPPLVTLQTGPGVAITSGAILITSSRTCPCGRSFIPNHPSRTHCPTCRPPRRRK